MHMPSSDVVLVPFPRVFKFPVELHQPANFRASDPSSWPKLPGRLEFVGGRLLYMPPCGSPQQGVCADTVGLLRDWSRRHPGYWVGSNEAGMLLDDEVRAADAAVWRKSDVVRHGYQRRPPLLAVEVEGDDEDETVLQRKASWYIGRGVRLVWLVLHSTREVIVVREGERRRFGIKQRLPAERALPGLRPRAADFFVQLV